jgi:hypothetical protein
MFKAKGKPFKIRTPGKLCVMITSDQHIHELDSTPRLQLSLHAVAKEVSYNSLLVIQEALLISLAVSATEAHDAWL